jgi:hypothetical protein
MAVENPPSQVPENNQPPGQLDDISFNFEDPNSNPVPNQEEFPPGFDQNFLKNVNPEDRAAVARYWKQINGGVTKHIQGIHDQYSWAKDLQADEVTQALHLLNSLNSNPAQVSRMIYEAAKEMYPDQFDDGQQQQTPPETDLGTEPKLPEHANLPKEFLDEYQQMKQIVQSLGQDYLSDKQARQQQQEDAALDAALKDLHTRYGNIDDDYVLLQLSKGKTPDEAAKAFIEFRDNLINSRTRKPPPNVLPGGGSLLPNGQVNGSPKMDSKARRELIASVLTASKELG